MERQPLLASTVRVLDGWRWWDGI